MKLPIENYLAAFPPKRTCRLGWGRRPVVIGPLTLGGVIALDAVGVNPQAEVGEDHAAIAAFVLSGQMEGRTMGECERDFKRFARRVKRHLNELAEAVNATLAEGFATYVKPAPSKGPAQTTPSGVGWWLSYAEAICGDYGWSWKETLSTPLATVFALAVAYRARHGIDNGDSDYIERAYIKEHFRHG